MTGLLLAAAPGGDAASPAVVLVPLGENGSPTAPPQRLPVEVLPAAVARREAETPGLRWIWTDTREHYPALLAADVRVARCHDLGLAETALRAALPSSAPSLLAPRSVLDPGDPAHQNAGQDALFVSGPSAPDPLLVAAEYARQLAALPTGVEGARLRLLTALDSAGSLAAAEMRYDGLPWDRREHEGLLAQSLGPRPLPGGRPAVMEELADHLRRVLDAPRLNPDSQPELLRALRAAGLDVTSTRQWELAELDHPVIEPLLAYKKLQRLFTANGWAWLDAWVREGRFHPEYHVAGVVTGRWSSHGGGALQIPHEVRSAVRADSGHVLVVADASQLEPRVLAALSRDDALAEAARGQDLYQGIADRVFGGERPMAKVAMLGAMYGGTTGPSAEMAPRLAAAYPRATALLEKAARTGELGGSVRSFLGRTSPAQQTGRGGLDAPGPGDDDGSDARSSAAAARARGRFTRNFVVQSTAAEWAMAWMAGWRARLRERFPASRLVFFLHDELMVHARVEDVDGVVAAAHEAAEEAARLLFGRIPVDFPVQVGVGSDYAEAK